MLPNFRRTEPELKSQSPIPANESLSFAPRQAIAPAPRTTDRNVSMIGPDLTITGNLISKGEVQVDGIVEGDIHGSHVVIGERATIHGSIVSDEVVIRGHVIGEVRAKRVMLQATSQVEGDIFHQSLSIEQGALFEGKSRRSADDPRAVKETAKKADVYAMPPSLG